MGIAYLLVNQSWLKLPIQEHVSRKEEISIPEEKSQSFQIHF